MADSNTPTFAARGTMSEIETGQMFQPKFDRDGLIAVIVTDKVSGSVLMFAHMNAEALQRTLISGEVHFWSRSRAKLWKKGEDSGNILTAAEIRTDCDQDVLWISAQIGGVGVACHTGSYSCFYRRLDWNADRGCAVNLQNAALPKAARA